MILHTDKNAGIDYGLQQITEFTYGSMRRELLITDVVKNKITGFYCFLNDDIEVTITNVLRTSHPVSSTTEQVDINATPTYS